MKYKILLDELIAIELWDSYYCRQDCHDLLEQDAYENRRKRRAEVLLKILKIIHGTNPDALLDLDFGLDNVTV